MTRPLGVAGAATRFTTQAVLHVVASRSDAATLAPVIAALERAGVAQAVARLVGDGVVHDELLDASGVPLMDSLVDDRVGSELERTARILSAAERSLVEAPPALVMVGGDTEGPLAFGLAASKLGVPVARVRAGLRCGDFSVPEEINRMLGDRVADLLFTDSAEAGDALEIEGIAADRVRFVGNPSVDLLRRNGRAARQRAAWRRLGVPPREFVLVTLHRPENVFDDERVGRIGEALAGLARRLPVVLPLHPTTRRSMQRTGDLRRLADAGATITAPLGYLDFLSLVQAAGAILTDSGGVQDEASALGVACFTLRRSTERVVTLTHGTNVLLGDDPAEVAHVRVEAGNRPASAIPRWDGASGKRIAAELRRRLAQS